MVWKIGFQLRLTYHHLFGILYPGIYFMVTHTKRKTRSFHDFEPIEFAKTFLPCFLLVHSYTS